MLIGLHIKHLLFLSDLLKLEFSRQTFEKSSNSKFRENLPSGAEFYVGRQM